MELIIVVSFADPNVRKYRLHYYNAYVRLDLGTRLNNMGGGQVGQVGQVGLALPTIRIYNLPRADTGNF